MEPQVKEEMVDDVERMEERMEEVDVKEEECRVSVWVCREEKLVSGLSRRTTCADVVRALLDERHSGASARSYCLVEKWRGHERVLPPRTRLLRLWSAWGREREHVRFVLVRSDASVPNGGARSAEARVVSSAGSRERAREREQSAPPVIGNVEGPGNGKVLGVPVAGTGTVNGTGTGPVAGNETENGAGDGNVCSRERQRRVVRKAFRKLERMKLSQAGKDGDARRKDAASADRMETLVHLVVSQDHTIRQQLERIRDLDGEIERYEARVHLDRVRRHGVNYVQDTYLSQSGNDPDQDDEEEGVKEQEQEVERLEEFASRWDEVIKLQEELAEREDLLDRLTGQIEEELNHRWMRRRREELKEPKETKDTGQQPEDSIQASVPQVEAFSDTALQLEEERIKTQLDTSLYIGLRLNTDLEALRGDLDMSREMWETRDRELRELLEKVDSLNEGEQDEGDGDAEFPPPEQSVGWVEEARGLSKSCNGGNDDDSDTGLSSMHSQDSDNPPVCESLV